MPAGPPRTRPRSPTSKLPTPSARFTRPILEAAEIALDLGSSGAAGDGQLLKLIEAADSGSLRESVREALN